MQRTGSICKRIADRRTDFETEYREKAEENMVNLVKEAQESKKKIILSGMVSALCDYCSYANVCGSGAFPMEDWMRIALIAVGIVVIVIGIAIACILDRDAGSHECPGVRRGLCLRWVLMLWDRTR